jgi:hypothetical protein
MKGDARKMLSNNKIIFMENWLRQNVGNSQAGEGRMTAHTT